MVRIAIGLLPLAAAALTPSPAEADEAKSALESAKQYLRLENCEGECQLKAVVVASLATADHSNACLSNPIAELYTTETGTTMQGFAARVLLSNLTDMTSTSSDVLEDTVFLTMQVAQETACLPTFIIAEGHKFRASLIGSSDLFPSDAVGAAAGGMFGGLGTFFGGHTLLRTIFGSRKHEFLDIKVLSEPAGATLLMGSKDTGFRTNGRIAIAARRIKELRLQSGDMQVSIRQCHLATPNDNSLVLTCNLRRR